MKLTESLSFCHLPHFLVLLHKLLRNSTILREFIQKNPIFSVFFILHQHNSSCTFTGSTHVNIMYLQGASDVAVLENFREPKSVNSENTLNIYSKDGKNVCTLRLFQVKFNRSLLGPV